MISTSFVTSEKKFQKSSFLNISWVKKLSQKLYFLQIYDNNKWRNNYVISATFLIQKNTGKNFFFLTILVSRIFFKRVISIDFLPQKFTTKYGILSTFSVPFVSWKILTCLQCNCILMCGV